MSSISLAKRESLPSKQFAVPASKARKIGVSDEIQGEAKGKYPVDTKKRARNALARVSQHGTVAERALVRRKVYGKFPELKERFEEQHGGASPTSNANVTRTEQGNIGKTAAIEAAAFAQELLLLKQAGLFSSIGEVVHRGGRRLVQRAKSFNAARKMHNADWERQYNRLRTEQFNKNKDQLRQLASTTAGESVAKRVAPRKLTSEQEETRRRVFKHLGQSHLALPAQAR